MTIIDELNFLPNTQINNGVTRTEQTELAYLTRGKNMWRRAHKELKKISPSIFIEWVEQKLPDLKRSSRRQYISSTRYLLKTMLKSDLSEKAKLALVASIKYADEMKSSKYEPAVPIKKKWRGNTSTQKSKKLNNKEFVLFLRQVSELKWKWSTYAGVWMAANRIVGLRILEWRNVAIKEVGNGIILEVRNGKNTNGRANGTLRHIDISDLKDHELNLIRWQLEFSSKFATIDVNWKAYYDGVRQAIYRIARLVQGHKRKYITLSTGRHQFSADAKASGKSKAELAALMGHASDVTAIVHYGKKRHGSCGLSVKPLANEVATVRIKADKILYKKFKY